MNKIDLRRRLASLSSEYLAAKLLDIAMYDQTLTKELELMALKNEPEKLAKKINREINEIKRSNLHIPWDEATEFASELYQIAQIIEQDLLPVDAQLAIELIEKFFHIDYSIFERVDDFDEEVNMFYRKLCELWGRAWLSNTNRDPTKLARKIYNLIIGDDCGVRDRIIEHSAAALGKDGLLVLETLVTNNKKHFGEYCLPWTLKAIADGLGDVDKYIEITKKYNSIDEDTVCEIAKRLIKKDRAGEAIELLLHIPDDISLAAGSKSFDPNKVTCTEHYDLLLKAYDSETMAQEATSLRWLLFQKNLNIEHYNGLLKYQSPEKHEKIKVRAFEFANNEYAGDIDRLLSFLSELKAFEQLYKVILQQYDLLRANSYQLYRPLSKTLAARGYPLAAHLLRRKLIDGILNGVKSDYYEYAVDDLKLASKYAALIDNWQGFPDHVEYMRTLKVTHRRKSAFWLLVHEQLSDHVK